MNDELITKIADMDINFVNNVAITEALILVIEMHTDSQIGPKNRGKSGLRARCTECGFAYPCPTITTIKSIVDQ